MTPKVGTVCEGFVVNLKNDIVNGINILNIRAVGNILGNVDNTRVVVAHADFGFAAAHTEGLEAGERPGSDSYISKLCAYLSESGFHTDSYVGCAANYVGELAVASVNL